jgi:hypothetical protein
MKIASEFKVVAIVILFAWCQLGKCALNVKTIVALTKAG